MTAVTDAAREVLAPLGLRQRGHSGVFIADHGFWIAIAEFREDRRQLSVGAHWLWYVQSRHCFDYGRCLDYRAERPHAMAQHAGEALAADAAQFRTVAAIARHLADPPDAPWPLYHAGAAAGLAGDRATAGAFFARLAARPARPGWEAELQAAGHALADLVADPQSFRTRVGAIVAQTRTLQGLPAATVSFD